MNRLSALELKMNQFDPSASDSQVFIPGREQLGLFSTDSGVSLFTTVYF